VEIVVASLVIAVSLFWLQKIARGVYGAIEVLVGFVAIWDASTKDAGALVPGSVVALTLTSGRSSCSRRPPRFTSRSAAWTTSHNGGPTKANTAVPVVRAARWEACPMGCSCRKFREEPLARPGVF
jgi:hypothetical protein